MKKNKIDLQKYTKKFNDEGKKEDGNEKKKTRIYITKRDSNKEKIFFDNDKAKENLRKKLELSKDAPEWATYLDENGNFKYTHIQYIKTISSNK